MNTCSRDGLDDSLLSTSEYIEKYTVRMPVGDINSDEKGSGARMNAGKPQVDLVPVRFWFELMAREYNRPDRKYPVPAKFITCVQALAEFQEGKGSGQEMLGSLDSMMFDHAVAVFEYGKDKYAAWNWLKGMPWSVPVACAVRHAKAYVLQDEYFDKESGLSHEGHFACNIMMLSAFDRWYPEGNDLPSEEYFSER